MSPPHDDDSPVRKTRNRTDITRERKQKDRYSKNEGNDIDDDDRYYVSKSNKSRKNKYSDNEYNNEKDRRKHYRYYYDSRSRSRSHSPSYREDLDRRRDRKKNDVKKNDGSFIFWLFIAILFSGVAACLWYLWLCDQKNKTCKPSPPHSHLPIHPPKCEDKDDKKCEDELNLGDHINHFAVVTPSTWTGTILYPSIKDRVLIARPLSSFIDPHRRLPNGCTLQSATVSFTINSIGKVIDGNLSDAESGQFFAIKLHNKDDDDDNSDTNTFGRLDVNNQTLSTTFVSTHGVAFTVNWLWNSNFNTLVSISNSTDFPVSGQLRSSSPQEPLIKCIKTNHKKQQLMPSVSKRYGGKIYVTINKRLVQLRLDVKFVHKNTPRCESVIAVKSAKIDGLGNSWLLAKEYCASNIYSSTHRTINIPFSRHAIVDDEDYDGDTNNDGNFRRCNKLEQAFTLTLAYDQKRDIFYTLMNAPCMGSLSLIPKSKCYKKNTHAFNNTKHDDDDNDNNDDDDDDDDDDDENIPSLESLDKFSGWNNLPSGKWISKFIKNGQTMLFEMNVAGNDQISQVQFMDYELQSHSISELPISSTSTTIFHNPELKLAKKRIVIRLQKCVNNNNQRSTRKSSCATVTPSDHIMLTFEWTSSDPFEIKLKSITGTSIQKSDVITSSLLVFDRYVDL